MCQNCDRLKRPTDAINSQVSQFLNSNYSKSTRMQSTTFSKQKVKQSCLFCFVPYDGVFKGRTIKSAIVEALCRHSNPISCHFTIRFFHQNLNSEKTVFRLLKNITLTRCFFAALDPWMTKYAKNFHDLLLFSMFKPNFLQSYRLSCNCQGVTIDNILFAR